MESWVVSLSEGEEQKVPDPVNGEELAKLVVDEAHFPPLVVGNAPPRDTGITPRVGSDHARTPNPFQPVVNPSPADTTLSAGPANEVDKGFPTNPTQPARGIVTARAHAHLGCRTGQRIWYRSYLSAPTIYIADRPLWLHLFPGIIFLLQGKIAGNYLLFLYCLFRLVSRLGQRSTGRQRAAGLQQKFPIVLGQQTICALDELIS
ncbi:hypothetical protein MRX96_036011 [Rhipicephalus microplus]